MGQVGFIIVSCRSPSQSSSQIDDFLSNFKKLFDDAHIFQPAFTVIFGDFNARLKSWWSGDSITIKGTRLDSLVSTHDFHQLISEPTHILRKSLFCIDLISTDQPSLVVDSVLHPTLHEYCHHQITYCKLNLEIEYPLPYERLVWDFKRTDVNAITTAINQVDWMFMFSYKNVHQQVNIFNETIINIFSNFIPNELVTFDDKDPPWMTEKLKEKIKWKHKVYRDYLKNAKTEAEMKLNNPKTNSKTCWSILKTFYNGRKIPIIPPLIKDGKLMIVKLWLTISIFFLLLSVLL